MYDVNESCKTCYNHLTASRIKQKSRMFQQIRRSVEEGEDAAGLGLSLFDGLERILNKLNFVLGLWLNSLLQPNYKIFFNAATKEVQGNLTQNSEFGCALYHKAAHTAKKTKKRHADTR
ncbi:hypothetical protein F511_17206 [Dorcoceras hygrometricum]|uniref:Uncharacterized protein n=1 Tax=Dorcoceras hygrometricum TaxID=472368 RepID=A0A2Z7B6Z9_9LAMI|nr:hypothetical protein F511_17206 [Dorcoceras hygrometricum]